MIEILAATGTGEAVTGAVGVTVGSLGLWILQQVLKRGVHAEIEVGDQRDAPQQPFCPVHGEFAAKLDERQYAIVASLDQILTGQNQIRYDIADMRTEIGNLHKRMDAVLDK